jgi:AraC-like DNA-binding protein
MKIFLRYISDLRYKELLKEELELIGEKYEISHLEESDLLISPEVKYKLLKNALAKYFGEVLCSAKGLLFIKLKTAVVETLRKHANGPPYIKYSSFLSEKLRHSYPYLSSLFSQMHGSTLEHYIISQRIEVVKRMLVQEGLGLSEIAWKLGYCSVPHLSNQFKKITGSTPTTYKTMAQHRAVPAGVLCTACKQAWVVSMDNG